MSEPNPPGVHGGWLNIAEIERRLRENRADLPSAIARCMCRSESNEGCS
jgi:hypothetical protein